MKTWLTKTSFGSLLMLMSIIPSFAYTSSYTGNRSIAPISTDQSSSEPGMKEIAPANTGDSWQRSASDAVRDAELATEKAYNDLARNIQNVSLEAKIMAVLHENKATRASDVQVTADKGVVTLAGQVPSAQDAQRVQDVVASVYGVTAVNNHLQYHRERGPVTPRDADSTGIAHPAYSDIAPAEKAPAH